MKNLDNNSRNHPLNLTGKNILIVDDDDASLKLYCTSVKRTKLIKK